ncbi:MAG: sodium-dependent transporter [Bacteroidales bacterium]|jgi:NSS family neurotransmitter:Na+ symporter|nr:sodium-dependent transporter [Bacteroidales bacterium]MCI1784835.1 sodium-dependent transporter [Bacteroidales bacterium]
MKERENFGSRFAVIMAFAGSAIGLGNIWRFPYMVGENGGAAFIIIYLLSSFFLSLPIFLSESVIGRRSHSNTFGAMEMLAPGTKWKWLGLLTVVSPLVILSFYSVVGGWSLVYLFKACSTGFTDSSMEEVSKVFGNVISSVWPPLIFHTLFLLICAVIIFFGVKSGIEKFSKITMPLLFVLIVLIMIYSVNLPGAGAGVTYLVKPDFSKITASVVAAAVGQSFFSLSLGVGTILTYSSYVRKDENILVSGIGTASLDLLFAILAGFAIMPAVFAAGIKPEAGPGLIFQTLPYIFSKMGEHLPVLSASVAVLFFITILVAALTSAISMFEVGVAYLVEERKFSRPAATAVVFSLTWVLGIFCSLSFGPLKNFHIFGNTIFSFCDKLTSNFLMTFGGLLFTIFVGWKMPRRDVRDEITSGGRSSLGVHTFNFVYFLIKYLAPAAIVLIFISNLIL